MKKVVITGATGAVGRALIKICKEAGYEVLALVHRGSLRAAELKDVNVAYLDLDEYDNALWELEKQGFSTVLQEEELTGELLISSVKKVYEDRENIKNRMESSHLLDANKTILDLITALNK